MKFLASTASGQTNTSWMLPIRAPSTLYQLETHLTPGNSIFGTTPLTSDSGREFRGRPTFHALRTRVLDREGSTRRSKGRSLTVHGSTPCVSGEATSPMAGAI